MSRRRAFLYAVPLPADVVPRGSVLTQDSPYLRLYNDPATVVVNPDLTTNANWVRQAYTGYDGGIGCYLGGGGGGYRLRFLGPTLTLAGILDPNGGAMNVVIDGVSYPGGSCYSPSAGTGGLYLAVTGLGPGLHEAVVTQAGGVTMFLDTVSTS